MPVQEGPSGTRSLGLSNADTCGACRGALEATAVLTAHLGPGYDQPAWGLVPHVGRAQAQTPALKWQQPQAFLMPTSPTEADIRSACQSGFTLQSVALERVIISTSGQDYNHKKKNGNSIHWNECSYCWTSDSQVTAQSSEGCDEFLWPRSRKKITGSACLCDFQNKILW